jgi:hypothetical protein
MSKKGKVLVGVYTPLTSMWRDIHGYSRGLDSNGIRYGGSKWVCLKTKNEVPTK